MIQDSLSINKNEEPTYRNAISGARGLGRALGILAAIEFVIDAIDGYNYEPPEMRPLTKF